MKFEFENEINEMRYSSYFFFFFHSGSKLTWNEGL